MRRLAGVALTAATLVHAARAQDIAALVKRMNDAEAARKFAAAAALADTAYSVTGFDPAMRALAAMDFVQAGDDMRACERLRDAISEGYLDAGFLRYLKTDTGFVRTRRVRTCQAALADADARLAVLDTALRAELVAMAAQDQRNREGLADVVTEHGRASRAADSAFAALDRADAPLLARLQAIVAARGWPGRRLVADDGAHAAWLIAQHAPPAVQRTLLPLVAATAKKREARPSDVALLEDRVRVADGKLQRYGSQLEDSDTPGPPSVRPIEDEGCVDKRRASVGLGALADYLRSFGITYARPANAKCR